MNLNKVSKWLNILVIIISILICVISYEQKKTVTTWTFVSYTVIAIIEIIQLVITEKHKDDK